MTKIKKEAVTNCLFHKVCPDKLSMASCQNGIRLRITVFQLQTGNFLLAKQAILAFLASTKRPISIIPEAPLWTVVLEKTDHDRRFRAFYIVPDQFPS